MKAIYTHSFNRHWHIVWSWKQFMFGWSVEFKTIYIFGFGFFSVTWIRS